MLDDGSKSKGQYAYSEQLFGKMDAHGFSQSDIKLKKQKWKSGWFFPLSSVGL